MKFNDDITQSIAVTVSDVLEGKATKKEEVKYPHDMFHPETGEKEVAKTPEDHEKLAKQGYTHEKPKLDEVEQPRADGEKDFKKMHDDNIEVSGELPDGKVTKAKKANYYKEETKSEESEKQAKYKKFFDAALKKFGVSSPAELEGDKKKEFFDYVDSNYDAGDNESDVDEAILGIGRTRGPSGLPGSKGRYCKRLQKDKDNRKKIGRAITTPFRKK
jgi:hypothetical protein